MGLLEGYPPQDSPGRPFYSNLKFFLLDSTFTTPGHATADELRLYVDLMRKLADRGEVERAVADAVLARLARDASTRL